MKVKDYVFAVGILLALFVGVNFPIGGQTTIERVVQGTGQDFDAHQFFRGGSTNGGYFATSSTATTYTLTSADLKDHTVINWTPNVNTTISFDATSTRALVPNVGDSMSVYFRNASSTAASSITFAAEDLGVDLQFAEATGGDLVLNGLDWEKLTFIRNSGVGVSQVTVLVDEMTEAD